MSRKRRALPRIEGRGPEGRWLAFWPKARKAIWRYETHGQGQGDDLVRLTPGVVLLIDLQRRAIWKRRGGSWHLQRRAAEDGGVAWGRDVPPWLLYRFLEDDLAGFHETRGELELEAAQYDDGLVLAINVETFEVWERVNDARRVRSWRRRDLPRFEGRQAGRQVELFSEIEAEETGAGDA